jgi:hypothetical protein
MSLPFLRRAARPAVVLAVAALALGALAGPGRADEQRVSRFGVALYAMPTSLALGDVNDQIDRLNELTGSLSEPLAPIDQIHAGAQFGFEGKFFATHHWAVVAGLARIGRDSKLELQPQNNATTTVKAHVRTVPRYLGVDYYFDPKTSGDFTMRPFVGGGFMDLVETKTSFGYVYSSPDSSQGSIPSALGEGNGFYLEAGVHGMFPGRYSLLVNAYYRSASVKRMYDETTYQLITNTDGSPFTTDISGFGIRFGVQINILGKPPE